MFLGCTSLTTITIPNRVTDIEDGWFGKTGASGAFWGSTSLTNVMIGNSVTNIGDCAFWGCTGLTSLTIPKSVIRIGDHAFYECTSLTSVTFPKSVINIEDYAFAWCPSLTSVYFQGNAPSVGVCGFSWPTGQGEIVDPATAYYLPGTTGWSINFGGLPTAPWVLPYPVILTTSNFGIQTTGFGFRISWATNITAVVVEACPSLMNPAWVPVSTNTLVNGWTDFSDPQWTHYLSRFYRVRSL